MNVPPADQPQLAHTIAIPAELCTTATVDGTPYRFGGDLRLGDLRGTGSADVLVYRSVEGAHDGGGMKPCFLGACTSGGQVLWVQGSDGEQPARPGPVALYDIDGDGADEVICFFVAADRQGGPGTMTNVVVQVRSGRNGQVLLEAAPEALRHCQGSGPNWVHQRLLIANLRGTARAADLVVKLGSTVLALNDRLEVLWTYEVQWNEYGRCAAYIPAVGDIDGDGCDEVNGGYFLLDQDGRPLWEAPLAPHMDSVAITAWDRGTPRAICSGGGHVMDAAGHAVLQLGEEIVPHGQEVRVGTFVPDVPAPQLAIRYNAHTPAVLVAANDGSIVARHQLNESPNNTGMEMVLWRGQEAAALLYNGGMLWDLASGEGMALPGLPPPQGPSRQGWYHCIPADLCGDAREEVLLYNPWDCCAYVYTPAPAPAGVGLHYRGGPRQYNARLMD